jgi:hypothetical protein
MLTLYDIYHGDLSKLLLRNNYDKTWAWAFVIYGILNLA